MRILLLPLTLIFSITLHAQSLKLGSKDSSYHQLNQNRKWFVTSFSQVGIAFNFVNGSRATVLSAPVGLQLNHRLNDNLYAFTGVSLAPTYVNFSHPYLSPGIKSYTGNGIRSDYFGVYPSINAGLMYVNDARTFSFSGSIGIQRSNYPMLLYSPASVPPVNSFISSPVYR